MKAIYSFLIIFSILLFGAFSLYKTYYINGYVFKSDGITPLKGANIELYTKPNGGGEKVISIESDKSGFFKSEKPIDFTNGLYPSVKYNNKTNYMSFPVKTGNCMICHSNNKITVK